MKKIVPMILIFVGLAELVMVFLDIKIPVIITMALGVLFVALGVKMLLDTAKKER